MADDMGHLPAIPNDTLQDLCSRFLINIPENEKNDMVRICFQIELAHWYYIDFCRQDDPDLPPCGMKAFIAIIFSQFSFLNKSKESIHTIYENWRQYKVRVPVFGAILLDETLDKCLLVLGFHNKTSWGFPKGKVNKDEADLDCAIREVQEEVGFDISALAKSDQFLENNIHDHQVRLYIVPGVPENYHFQPNTRGEIKDIRWFNIFHLPTHKKDPTPKDEIGLMANNFFMIHSFIRPLRKWVNEKKEKMNSFFMSDPILNFKAKPILHEEKAQDDYSRKLRYEEESEKFKHLHINPLRASKQEEDTLKSLLGMNVKNASPKPTDQPEAIRKLLTGTVEISPKTTPERPKPFKTAGQNKHSRRSPNNSRSSPKTTFSVGRQSPKMIGRQSPKMSHGRNSPKNDLNSGRRNPASRLSYSNITAKNLKPDKESKVTPTKNINKDFYTSISVQNQPIKKTLYSPSLSPDIKAIDSQAYNSEKKVEAYWSADKFSESYNSDKIRTVSNKAEPYWRGFGDFYYSAPAFENFRFDYDKILKALNI